MRLLASLTTRMRDIYTISIYGERSNLVCFNLVQSVGIRFIAAFQLTIIVGIAQQITFRCRWPRSGPINIYHLWQSGVFLLLLRFLRFIF